MSHSPAARKLFVVSGVPLDNVSLEDAAQVVEDAVRGRRRCLISTANLNFFSIAKDSTAFRQSLLASDLCTIDGAPVLWMTRLMRLPFKSRAAGSDFYEYLRSRRRTPPLKVFFFGGPEGAAKRACGNLNAAKAGLTCTGWHDPGFVPVPDMSAPRIIDKINDSGADILIVALGAKKGQEWLMLNDTKFTVPVRVHLGAVVNFEAGTVLRAPALIRRLGFEWAWRIKEEPRLVGRYLKDAATLVSMVVDGFGQRAASAFGAQQDFTFQRAAESGRAMMHLSGDACTWSAGALNGLLRSLETERMGVDFDCQGLGRIDAFGLGVFLQAHRKSATRLHGLQQRHKRYIDKNNLGFLIAPAPQAS